jgi:hypothetical protein
VANDKQAKGARCVVPAHDALARAGLLQAFSGRAEQLRDVRNDASHLGADAPKLIGQLVAATRIFSETELATPSQAALKLVQLHHHAQPMDGVESKDGFASAAKPYSLRSKDALAALRASSGPTRLLRGVDGSASTGRSKRKGAQEGAA